MWQPLFKFPLIDFSTIFVLNDNHFFANYLARRAYVAGVPLGLVLGLVTPPGCHVFFSSEFSTNLDSHIYVNTWVP